MRYTFDELDFALIFEVYREVLVSNEVDGHALSGMAHFLNVLAGDPEYAHHFGSDYWSEVVIGKQLGDDREIPGRYRHWRKSLSDEITNYLTEERDSLTPVEDEKEYQCYDCARYLGDLNFEVETKKSCPRDVSTGALQVLCENCAEENDETKGRR